MCPMKSVFRPCLSLLSVATAVAATQQFERVVVEGVEEPSLTVPSLEEARTQLERTPGGVTLVRGEDIRLGRASTLRDALDFTPGVFVQSRFGAEEARISIRGSGLQRTFHGRGLKLLQDGVPLNLADGSFDMQAVEPLATRYVEVWRGANALRYGGTTLGGAVNFVSPSGRDARPFEGRAEAGSFGYVRAQVSSGFAAGAVDGFASFSHFAQEGFREHARQEARRFVSNVGYRIGERVENRLWFTAVGTDSQLPGSLTLSNALNRPRLGNFAGDQKRDFSLFRVSDRLAWIGDASEAQVSGFWSHKDLDHPIFQVIDQNSNDLGIEGRFTRRGEWLGRENTLTAGVLPVYGWVEDNRFVNGAFAGRPRRGARTGEATQRSMNLDGYIEDSWQVSRRWTPVLGVSVNYARREFEDRFLRDGDQTDTQEYLGFNPKLGAVFAWMPGAQLFANVSRSFEPPSFGELTAPATPGATNGLVRLDAQTGTTLEVGTRGRRGRFSWDVAWYRAWLDNELLSLQVGDFNPPVTQTVNAGRTLHHGIELGATARLLEGVLSEATEAGRRDDLLVQLTYLWSDFRFEGDPRHGDNRLPGIPRHHVRAELRYEHGSGLYVGPNVEWAPEAYPVDLANTRATYAPGFAILGVRAGYRTRHGLSVFVDARNLTDEAYVATTGVLNRATPGSAAFNPGDGRAFYGGVELRW
jgi:iron complex outermembrane recepter protein